MTARAGRVLGWATLGTTVIVATVVLVALAHAAVTKDMLALQACMEVDRPPLNWLCKQSLYRLHPTATEVKELNQSAGAQFPAFMRNQAEAGQLLRHLLQSGVDINAVDQRIPTHWTALHLAAAQANVDAIRLLLKHGAQPDVKDAAGRTPLDLAKERQLRNPAVSYAAAISLLEAAQQGH